MSAMATEPTRFEGWAILELMGHRRLAGYVREVELAGAGVLRLDVPGPDGQPICSQFYSPAALYCLTPTTEEVARRVAAAADPAPVKRWELPSPPRPQERPLDELLDDDLPDGESSVDPVLDSDEFEARVEAGENRWLVAVEVARKLGDPRAERWAQDIDDARAAAKDGELR